MLRKIMKLNEMGLASDRQKAVMTAQFKKFVNFFEKLYLMPGVFVAVTKEEDKRYKSETMAYLQKMSDSKSDEVPFLRDSDGECENLRSFLIMIFSWQGVCHVYSVDDINNCNYILHFANITDDEKRQLYTVGFQSSNNKGGFSVSPNKASKIGIVKNSVCITFADLYDNIDEIYDLFYED